MNCKKCDEPLDMKEVLAALDYPYIEISFVCKNCHGFNYALIPQDAFILDQEEEDEDNS